MKPLIAIMACPCYLQRLPLKVAKGIKDLEQPMPMDWPMQQYWSFDMPRNLMRGPD